MAWAATGLLVNGAASIQRSGQISNRELSIRRFQEALESGRLSQRPR
jgi:hypothetical protein